VNVNLEMKRPWKCPNCKYISTRNWNVKSHIMLSHNGRGIPVQLGKRNVQSSNQSIRETVIDQLQETNLSSRLPTFFNDIFNNEDVVTLLTRQFFVDADKQDKFLFEILEGLSPQFQEEQLLNTISCTDLQKAKILGWAVCSAIISPNPTTNMSDSLATYRLLITIRKMFNCVSITMKANPEITRGALKRLAIDKYLDANKSSNNDQHTSTR
jgi:hypothetical protein